MPSVAGCSAIGSSTSGKVCTKPGQVVEGKPIGDGSTAYTGKQPNQPPAPQKLEPGQDPQALADLRRLGVGQRFTGSG
ncbi:hypothetical protein [Streptomyces sp. GS7]|uniref:hypothetical protein n=1 Tax=Streptomyces sp. GS7 TaxID=2692234 RepID=UPI001F3667F7|nr:hypothetical protein [Streptomyces sp. GS7]